MTSAVPTTPERRKGPLGQPQVRIRDEWLDEEAPGTMAAWAEWQAEGCREASQARHTTKRKPSPKAKPAPVASRPYEPPKRVGSRPGPKGSTQVRIGDVWISERIADAYDTVQRLGTVRAAADELGTGTEAVRNAVRRYEARVLDPASDAPTTSEGPDPEASAPDVTIAGEDLGPIMAETPGVAETVDALKAWAERQPELVSVPPTELTEFEPAKQVVDIAYASGYAVAVLRIVAGTHPDVSFPSSVLAAADDAADLLEALR